MGQALFHFNPPVALKKVKSHSNMFAWCVKTRYQKFFFLSRILLTFGFNIFIAGIELKNGVKWVQIDKIMKWLMGLRIDAIVIGDHDSQTL